MTDPTDQTDPTDPRAGNPEQRPGSRQQILNLLPGERLSELLFPAQGRLDDRTFSALEGQDLGPGDALLVNDPYSGATHLNDVYVISPVYLQGRRFGYVANGAHWVDVGGAAPASLPLSREVYQEGLIIPPLVFQKGGDLDQRLLDLVLANVRAKKEVAGDLRASTVAACQLIGCAVSYATGGQWAAVGGQ